MTFINSAPKVALGLTLTSLIALSNAASAPSPTPPERSSRSLVSDLMEVHQMPFPEHARSASERERATAIMDRLNKTSGRDVAEAVVTALRNAKSENDVVEYRALLPNLPQVKDHLLKRISTEPDATVKGRLVICIGKVQGGDVLRTLVAQLEDKRPVNSREGPSTLRICDYAFNIIYLRLVHVDGLGLDQSSDRSATMARGVPIDWREARIAKLKQALLEKFGPDHRFPEDL